MDLHLQKVGFLPGHLQTRVTEHMHRPARQITILRQQCKSIRVNSSVAVVGVVSNQPL